MTNAEDLLPLAVGETWVATGDIRVDSAIELLDGVKELPLQERGSVFEDVHRRLQQTLADASGA